MEETINKLYESWVKANTENILPEEEQIKLYGYVRYNKDGRRNPAPIYTLPKQQ